MQKREKSSFSAPVAQREYPNCTEGEEKEKKAQSFLLQ
jgi:hypothetical protein